MTLGNVVNLYNNLKNIDDKRIISKYFGINQTVILEDYMETIRVIRNICAHGSHLYDICLIHRIKNGPAGNFNSSKSNTLPAVLDVILYMIGTISLNRKDDFIADIIETSTKAIKNYHALRPIIDKIYFFKKMTA